MTFKLNLQLHKNQLVVYNDNHRFKIVVAGRQWGKSRLATRAAAGEALTHDGSIGMVVAPYADQAHKDYEEILAFIPHQYIKEVSARWLTITLKNGSKIMMRSAENLVGLRGFTLDWLIIDEAAMCDQAVWTILEPELGVRKGKAWIIGSPYGRGWFYALSKMEDKDPNRYKTFHFTSYDNPFWDKKELDAYILGHSELEYRQEIMAEFLEGGIVFPHLVEIMTSDYRDPVPGHQYTAGCDIASVSDFTVIKVFDNTDNHEVYHERFTKRDWGYNRTSIYSVCKRYNSATLIIDKTGVGAPVVEDLERMDCAYEGAKKEGYLTVIPVIFSQQTKTDLYRNYIMMQQNHTIHLIPEPVTKEEHESFLGQLSQETRGYMKYGAPKGMHDDCVTAAALAAWGLEKVMGTGLMGTIEPIGKRESPEITNYDEEDVAAWEEDAGPAMGVGKAANKKTLEKFFQEKKNDPKTTD